jgi:hypothetical protein
MQIAFFAAVLFFQQAAVTDPWQAVRFLEGTWSAETSTGSAGAIATGTYTFKRDLNGHVLVRVTEASGCKGPADFDCDHTDLLTVYQEAKGEPLQAIYFDNEGHVIRYRVSSAGEKNVVFLSDPTTKGPQYQLLYELKGDVMNGKFQMRMPGKTQWTSYLEWSGTKK